MLLSAATADDRPTDRPTQHMLSRVGCHLLVIIGRTYAYALLASWGSFQLRQTSYFTAAAIHV